MKKTAQFKFFIGIVAVVSLAVSLFIYLDYSMSRVQSIDAQLESDDYTVGIDYSGVITQQFVDEGAYVENGDPLFKIRSSTLAEAIKDNEIAKTALLYSVDDEGNVLISASAPGRVQSIAYREGAFVPANSQIAVINNKDGLYISATYSLSSPDYSRLNTNSKVYVTMPDGAKVQAIVYDIVLEKKEGDVLTTVMARFDNEQINTTAFSVGTPVETTLELSTDTLFERIKTRITALFSPAA
jgi:multidrug resistance efflux pump